MARLLRVEFPGAIYHVINRGNYRRDLFESDAAACSFENTVLEACSRMGWILHAQVLMRNHFHLAIETPSSNLVAGMQWLQGTFAARFNRFRAEHGHLFQGRYKALLIEEDGALARVADYIHLNPVRAGIVTAENVASYPWSSLRWLAHGPRPACLQGASVLTTRGLQDSPEGWSTYIGELVELARDQARQKALGFETFCRGWAIGTSAWRKAVAEEHRHLALHRGVSRGEAQQFRETYWTNLLEKELRAVDSPLRASADPAASTRQTSRWAPTAG